MRYRITYDEHTNDTVVIDADGPQEALEAFWVAYNAGTLDNEWHESSGPTAVLVLGEAT
jgi:hypothetical protein